MRDERDRRLKCMVCDCELSQPEHAGRPRVICRKRSCLLKYYKIRRRARRAPSTGRCSECLEYDFAPHRFRCSRAEVKP